MSLFFMSIKTRFCAKCGKETDLTVDGLCADCYLEANPLKLPRRISLIRCGKCKAVKHKGVWVESDLDITNYAAMILREKINVPDAIYIENIEVSSIGPAADVVVRYSILSKEFVENFKLDIIVNEITCKTCGRIAGKAHRAILQLRTSVDVEKFLDGVEAIVKEPGANYIILKSKNFQEGVDLYMLDKRSAKQLAQKIKKAFGGKITQTYKLSGWDKTKNRPSRIFSILLRIS